MKIIVKTENLINSNLWQLFPVINVDRVKNIPKDYPGAMGVPITAMNFIVRNDGRSGFELLDLIRPIINGKALYKRLIIRNLKPDLPEEIDLVDCLARCGVEIEAVIVEGGGLNVKD